MASIYKNFGSNDVVSTRTLLHENIPVTSSVISGALSNVKTYSHGMFESVYDYTYTSTAANQLFDITAGRSAYATSSTDDTKKKSIYNQMAKVLLGQDTTGSILKFDDDGLTVSNVDTQIDNMYFINLSRLLVKDEIKKGSFSMKIGMGQTKADKFKTSILLQDVSGATNYKVDSPTGEYSILYVVTSSNTSDPVITNNAIYSPSNTTKQVSASQGLVFYQAGIVALSPYIFSRAGTADPTSGNPTFNYNSKGIVTSSFPYFSSSVLGNVSAGDIFVSSSINVAAEELRSRIESINFNNTTELNSTIYFCRIQNNEFNYSANPTYLVNGSEIRVKNSNALNAPVSYITTVGLYSSDNQLLAVAKLSEPIKKDPTQELILRVRLDY